MVKKVDWMEEMRIVSCPSSITWQFKYPLAVILIESSFAKNISLKLYSSHIIIFYLVDEIWPGITCIIY